MTTIVLDNVKASEIAHSNETALAITEALKDRERNRKFTDIERTRKLLVSKQLKIDQNDYNKFWKDMQSAGFGTVVYGRKGNPDRFAWNYNLKDVASAALSNPGEIPSTESVEFRPTARRGRPKGSKNRRSRKPSNIKMSVAEHRVITLKLRPRMQMDVIIPNDVTKAELSKVAEAIKTL